MHSMDQKATPAPHIPPYDTVRDLLLHGRPLQSTRAYDNSAIFSQHSMARQALVCISASQAKAEVPYAVTFRTSRWFLHSSGSSFT